MKAFLFFLALIPFCNSLSAQNSDEPDYILIEGKDTVFCEITYILRSAGNITRINYTRLDDKSKVELKKDITPSVKFLRVGGRVITYVPASASRPDGAKKHMTIIADGKIKVYQENRTGVSTNKKGVRQIYIDETYGNEINPIELENGKYCDMKSKKDLNEILIPLFLKCEAFKDSFGTSITKKNLFDAIVEYNDVCQ